MVRASEIETVLQRAGRPTSARDIHRELRLPAGKPTAVNSVLYSNPDKFSYQNGSPPLWRLARQRSAVDLDQLMSQIEQIATRLLDSRSESGPEVRDNEYDAEYVGEPCPEQIARQPSYGTAPFRMTWLPLPPGGVVDTSWAIFAKRLDATVDSHDFDEVVLDIPEAVARTALRSTPTQIHLERVIDVVPYWVAWFIDFDENVLLPAHDRGWHIWSLADPAAWDDRDALISQAEIDGVEEFLATWRSRAPLGIIRSIGGLSYEQCGVRTPSGIELRIKKPNIGEVRQREREVAQREHDRERLGHVWKGFRNPVAGACSICGQPLRDPVSLQRGVGPHCWERYGHIGLTPPEMRADVPARHWVGCQAVSEWRKRFG